MQRYQILTDLESSKTNPMQNQRWLLQQIFWQISVIVPRVYFCPVLWGQQLKLNYSYTTEYITKTDTLGPDLGLGPYLQMIKLRHTNMSDGFLKEDRIFLFCSRYNRFRDLLDGCVCLITADFQGNSIQQYSPTSRLSWTLSLTLTPCFSADFV